MTLCLIYIQMQSQWKLWVYGIYFWNPILMSFQVFGPSPYTTWFILLAMGLGSSVLLSFQVFHPSPYMTCFVLLAMGLGSSVFPSFSPISLLDLLHTTSDGFRSLVIWFLFLRLLIVLLGVVFCLDFDPILFFLLLFSFVGCHLFMYFIISLWYSEGI
jgi:hypothetical protein